MEKKQTMDDNNIQYQTQAQQSSTCVPSVVSWHSVAVTLGVWIVPSALRKCAVVWKCALSFHSTFVGLKPLQIRECLGAAADSDTDMSSDTVGFQHKPWKARKMNGRELLRQRASMHWCMSILTQCILTEGHPFVQEELNDVWDGIRIRSV